MALNECGKQKFAFQQKSKSTFNLVMTLQWFKKERERLFSNGTLNDIGVQSLMDVKVEISKRHIAHHCKNKLHVYKCILKKKIND